MKAIETNYKGYRFRSRLEARWAVVFETLGIGWRYEPEGFEREFHYDDFDGGDDIIETKRYLPDFQIFSKLNPDRVSSYWVEVKGDPSWLQTDRFDLARMHNSGGILPGFANCGKDRNLTNGLILLGEIPAPEFGATFVPVLVDNCGVHLYWCLMFPRLDGVCFRRSDDLFSSFWKTPAEHNIAACAIPPEDLSFQTRIAKTPLGHSRIRDALSAARAARFEHGEVPA